MHIIYAVNVCSPKAYRELFAGSEVKGSFQVQKYHNLLIEGLTQDAEVDVLANPPVNRETLRKSWVFIPKERTENAVYWYAPAIRNAYLRMAVVGIGTFFKTLFFGKRDSVVIVDVLNQATSLSALIAAKLRRIPCVGIITDLPDMLGNNAVKLSNYVIRFCDGYVLLTQAMNDYIGNNSKLYVVLEGHADISMRDRQPSQALKTAPRVVMYAGAVNRQYGLQNLVEGFLLADIPNARLEIYGPGDYVEELKQVAARDDRVYYGGMLLNEEIVEKEMAATLLVNPRPTHEEYVKYSFPSKTMEYMASGTPVAMTELPGMPEEYKGHVYLLRDESANGIGNALKQILSQTDEALFCKGEAARAFVLDTRNNVIQARKILDMLEEMQR